jgi:uncharacterized protein (TIRG00374 family)
LNRTVVRTGATLLATVALLGLLLRRFGGGSAVAVELSRARPSWVAVALLAAGASVLLGAERWRLVLGAMGYKLGFRRSLEAVLATWPLAIVAPSRTNDLLRPFAVRDLVPMTAATGSVLAEKAMDLLTMLLFAAVGASIRGLWNWTAALGGLAVAEIVVVAILAKRRDVFARLPPVRRRRHLVEELFSALDSLRRAPRQLVAAVAASLGIRLLTLAIAQALFVAVNARVALFDTATLWPAATLVGNAPLTLVGIGTRDATFLHLLAERRADVDPAQVLAATLSYPAIAIGVFAVAGLPFMIREMLRQRRTVSPVTPGLAGDLPTGEQPH